MEHVDEKELFILLCEDLDEGVGADDLGHLRPPLWVACNRDVGDRRLRLGGPDLAHQCTERFKNLLRGFPRVDFIPSGVNNDKPRSVCQHQAVRKMGEVAQLRASEAAIEQLVLWEISC